MEIDEDDILLALLAEQLESNGQFWNKLSLQSKRMRCGTIHRGVLMPPSQSAFQYLFNSGQDDALVTLCGFDHASFNDLHALFKTQFDKYSPYGKNGMVQQEDSNWRSQHVRHCQVGKEDLVQDWGEGGCCHQCCGWRCRAWHRRRWWKHCCCCRARRPPCCSRPKSACESLNP